jgi:uncharacterized protein YeeX (DUF496 family)
MSDNDKLIRQVRTRLHAERKLVSDLDPKIKHDSIRQLLRRASSSLDDVDNIFLRSAEQERRTPDALRRWLGNTYLIFHIAAQQRRVVKGALAMYGPDVMAI